MFYKNLIIKDNDGKTRETLKVSRLCFGSLCVGPLQSDFSVKDGARVINHAFNSGVNFIDTAQLYRTYPYIKAALDLCENKNEIIISTKTFADTKKRAKEAFEQALAELGRDYIDIFLLHEQESIHTIYGHIEALEYLFEQKRKGLIKAVGISTHRVSGVLGAIEFNRTYKKDKLEVIHPMYNMTGLGIVPENQNENAINQMETVLKQAKTSGFFVFSMKGLGGGNLFAKAEEALKFCIDKPFIDSVAVGMKSADEVDANVKLFETGKFPDEYYKNYTKLAKEKYLHIETWCEGCGKCVDACKSEALKINPAGKAECDKDKCVLCGYCSTACSYFFLRIV